MKPIRQAKTIEIAVPESDPKRNGDDGFDFIESENFQIHFWSSVDNNTTAQLNQTLIRLDREARLHAVEFGVSPVIDLHIHSYGGYVSAAMATYDIIRTLKTPVHTIVEGVAASAATLIAQAGTHRVIMPNSTYLVHQLSGIAWGTYEQVQDDVKHMDMLMKQIVNLYHRHTDIAEEQIRDMLKRDYWMTPDEALALNFVDGIQMPSSS